MPGQRQRGPCQQGACPEAEGEHAIPRQPCGSIMQLRHLSLPTARAVLLPRPPHHRCLRCQGHGVPARPLAGAHRGARSAPARCSEHQQTRWAWSYGHARPVRNATGQAEEGWQISADLAGGACAQAAASLPELKPLPESGVRPVSPSLSPWKAWSTRGISIGLGDTHTLPYGYEGIHTLLSPAHATAQKLLQDVDFQQQNPRAAPGPVIKTQPLSCLRSLQILLFVL